MNLDTNMVSSFGGLTEKHAKAMNMEANMLPQMSLKKIEEKVETGANTGGDNLTSNHMRNWMECVRSRKEPNFPADLGYRAMTAIRMGVDSYRQHDVLQFDPRREKLIAKR